MMTASAMFAKLSRYSADASSLYRSRKIAYMEKPRLVVEIGRTAIDIHGFSVARYNNTQFSEQKQPLGAQVKHYEPVRVRGLCESDHLRVGTGTVLEVPQKAHLLPLLRSA
jgi:hypothetical protein